MAETPDDQENTGGNGQQAPSEEAPSEEAPSEEVAARLAPPATALTITRQYIKDLSFENPNAPDIFKDALEAPELRIKVDLGSTNLNEATYEVVVALQIEATKNQRTAFILDLQYGAMVTLAKELDENEANQILMVDTPQHLFPFIRATIANLTREGSFPPLLLNPIDFSQVYHQRRKRAAEAAADAQA